MCIHYLPEWAQQINSRNKQYSLLKLPTWWHRWSRERGEGRQRCKPRLESERGSGTLRGGLLMKLWRHHLDLRWMGILGYCFPKINVLSKVSTPKVHQKYEKVSEKPWKRTWNHDNPTWNHEKPWKPTWNHENPPETIKTNLEPWKITKNDLKP